MGKLEEETTVVLGEPPAPDLLSCRCTKSTWGWLLSVILGVYVLVFALWSIRFRGSSNRDSHLPSSDPWIPHIEASFTLSRSVSAINESLPQLQVDLQYEIGIPDTQIDIVSVVPLSYTNWTEVRFTVSPYPSNDFIAPAEISLLKDTFVELFMQRTANLSLTNDIFGKVSNFEVLHFPGGITVVPQQRGFPLSKVLVLFNFTLHNSLSRINCNFAEFRQQLANGIILKPNESLFVQLTNLEGSTLKAPLVVQTSILPVVGVLLPTTRLKQLAKEIIASPRRNLGLNHTLFGRVKKIELSSYLQYSLEPAQTPSPSPSPAPFFPPDLSPDPHNAPRLRGSRGHQRHSPAAAPSDSPYIHWARAPASEGIAATPHHYHHHHRHNSAGGLAPRGSTSHQSPYLSPSPLSSPPSCEHSSGYRTPPKFPPQSVPATAPSDAGKFHLPEGPAPADGSFVESPIESPTLSKVPSDAPQSFAPGFISGPSESPERSTFVPVASPTSSAIILGVPSWVMVMLLALLVGFW